MATLLFGARALIVGLLAVSTVAVALILDFLITRHQSADQLSIRPWLRGTKEFLDFVAGPFPLSIALHLGVLFFLVAGTVPFIEKLPMLVQFENLGGGGGGGGVGGD